MQILSKEMRDRAQVASERIEAERKAKQEAQAKEEANQKSKALGNFIGQFNVAVGEDFVERVNVNFIHKKITGSTTHKPCAKIPLADLQEIEIWKSDLGWGWSISYPELNKKFSWEIKTETVCFNSNPLAAKVSFEEWLLIRILEYEEDLAEYQDLQRKIEEERLALEAEEERQKQEQKRLRLALEAKEDRERQEMKAVDAEIRALIKEAIAPYHPQWLENFVLKVYEWKYCTGATEGEFDHDNGATKAEFDYDKVYSLSAQMEYDSQLDKFFVVTLKGDRIGLIPEIHKPVTREIVCHSLEEARLKLNEIAFYGLGYDYPVIGVSNDDAYWSWGGKDFYCFSHQHSHKQPKPWLRNLLGLPPLPESIQIYKL